MTKQPIQISDETATILTQPISGFCQSHHFDEGLVSQNKEVPIRSTRFAICYLFSFVLYDVVESELLTE
jgi:hypothetical protein